MTTRSPAGSERTFKRAAHALASFVNMANSRRPLAKTDWASLAVAFGLLITGLHIVTGEESSSRSIDPAGWGSNHVGQRLPQFVTGDECLFCHRDIGANWHENGHHLTVQPADPASPALQALAGNPVAPDIAKEVEFVLGRERSVRYLKRSEAYGQLEILSAGFSPGGPGGGHLSPMVHPQWESNTFGDRCAGCHATAVNSETNTFAAISLDCMTCHGDVPLEHANDPALVYLSDLNREPKQVISICGQCHLRGGTSRSTGRPYTNQFVAGDNLFLDFQIEWDSAQIDRMSPGDRHIYLNVREVALSGNLEGTCLTCHDVHAQSTEKHQELARTTICGTCHVGNQAVPSFQREEAHSSVCEY